MIYFAFLSPFFFLLVYALTTPFFRFRCPISQPLLKTNAQVYQYDFSVY